MLIWISGRSNGGGRYSPTTDTWQAISTDGAPVISFDHTAVWTGSEMLVWGADEAYQLVGGRYSPATDTWAPISTVGAAGGREGHAAVWTGQRMIVWGGYPWGQGEEGGRYDPAADTWATLASSGAPQPRSNHSAVWTGTEMIVYGGGYPGVVLRTGGRYNPLTDLGTDGYGA